MLICLEIIFHCDEIFILVPTEARTRSYLILNVLEKVSSSLTKLSEGLPVLPEGSVL